MGTRVQEQQRGSKGAAFSLAELWRKISLHLCVLIGSALGVALFLFVAALWVGSPLRDTVLSAHGILVTSEQDQPISDQQKAVLTEMLARGQIIPSDNLVSSVMQYYSNMVDFLVALIAALGFVGFIYVRNLSTDAAEESANRAVDRYFETKKFDMQVSAALETHRKTIDEQIADAAESLELEIERKTSDSFALLLGRLEGRFNLIEAKIAALDSEETGGEGALVKKGG